MYKGDEASRSENETARFFNEFFLSVYSAKIAYTLQVLRYDRLVPKTFDVSRSKLRCILTDLNITKSRIPNKIPPVHFKKTAVETNTTLKKLFRKVNRLRKLPRCWKDATIVPVHKKGNNHLVKNYRPAPLVKIDSKVFEKCSYDPLYHHFSF